MAKPQPNDEDRYIAKRAKQLRVSKGIKANEAAEILGMNAQQLSRYENGVNKMTASILFKMARTYDVPVSWFFLDIPENGQSKSPASYLGTDEQEELEIIKKRWGSLTTMQRATILKLLDSYL